MSREPGSALSAALHPSLGWSTPSIDVATMADPEDEVALLGPRVDHAEVPDPHLEQAGELSGERLPSEPLGGQDPLDPAHSPDRVVAIKLPQVLLD